MLGLLSFLAFACGISFVVSVVMLVVRSVKRNPRKPFVILAVVSVAAFLGLSVPISRMYVPPEKPAEIQTSEVENADDVQPVPSRVPASDVGPTSNAVSVDEPSTTKTDESAKDEQSAAQAENSTAVKKNESSVAEEKSGDSSEKGSTPVKKNEPVEKKDTSSALSDLVYAGESVIDVAVRDLVSGYDYIQDVSYVVDEKKSEVRIAVIVPSGSNDETVKKAGDKAARYLAALANFSCSEYAPPGADDLGGLFERYSLLLYVDDGNGGIDAYGAKVPSSPVISW